MHMVGVQIRLVKKLQTKLQTTNRTILKYDNEIIFVPSFISIGSFYAPAVFVRKREILNILNRENLLICQFRSLPNFARKINRGNFKLFFLE